MIALQHLQLCAIEQRVCELAAKHLGLVRAGISPKSTLKDLHFDSLDLFEFFCELEEEFGVTINNKEPNPIYKAVFTRQPFRLADIAEIVYLQRVESLPARN